MRVLVACEYSGTVRDAFIKKGHEAMSCDLLPTEMPGPHYQGSVLDILTEGWDLMICHPPCTYLSFAANRYWDQEGREEKRNEAMEFFMRLVNAPVAKIAIENPVGLPQRAYRKPDQIIEPFFFGEAQRKRTCLWLKNLRPLIHIKHDDLFSKATHVKPPKPIYRDKISGKARYFTDANHGGKIRSKSFSSIAEAMATQWG